MNIFKEYVDETVRAIGDITKFDYYTLINVKKIRKFYKIGSSDYSKINFYWRSLQFLEKNGIIQRYGSKTPKKYRVVNFFKLFELLHDSYIDQIRFAKSSS